MVDVDLYDEPHNFVFGLADPSSGRAVFALPWLKQESHGLPKDWALFRARLVKPAIPEIGHFLGLNHCGVWSCVMAFSNTLAGTHRQGEQYSARCQATLNP